MKYYIRWKQRFNNYLKALQTLVDAVELAHLRGLSKLEQLGLIQSFEFTHELAWNVLKDYLEDKGITSGTAQQIADDIIERFYPAFASMANKFSALHDQQDSD